MKKEEKFHVTQLFCATKEIEGDDVEGDDIEGVVIEGDGIEGCISRETYDIFNL